MRTGNGIRWVVTVAVMTLSVGCNGKPESGTGVEAGEPVSVSTPTPKPTAQGEGQATEAAEAALKVPTAAAEAAVGRAGSALTEKQPAVRDDAEAPVANEAKLEAAAADAPKAVQDSAAKIADSEAKPAQQVEQASPPPPLPPGKTEVKWDAPIDWKTWEEAATSNKPRMLLVYADWCPKCRALGPVFHDAEFLELTKSFTMVKQDQSAKPEWLQQYQSFGGYVPRVFFLDAEGKVREDLNSSHPRFPYFYAAQQMSLLKGVMKKALDG